LKSKRGISPILATLLLIVIAVAAIVVTYAWVITFTGSTTGQAGVILNKDAVNWQASNVTIYVRNSGISDAVIDSVYIGTSYENLVKQTSVTYDLPSKVVASNGGTITVTVTFSGVEHTVYYFKIAPLEGAPLQFTSECILP
jgi:flagellin-like protein